MPDTLSERMVWGADQIELLEPGDDLDEFADESADEVALAGPDGQAAAKLLAASQAHGVNVLADVTAAAVERLVNRGTSARRASSLFDDGERQRLADAIAATTGTAELLGRARVRERQERVEAAGVRKHSDATPFAKFAEAPPEPLPPQAALDYFKRLEPKVGVDPQRFGPRLERQAFTLAEATEAAILTRVKDVLTSALETGTGGTPAIQSILDAAGVTPKNPGYAENVFRTNMMDSYNTGAMQEMQDPDVADTFPVWQYSGIEDGRQRREHAKHFRKYFPNAVSFAEVRDSAKGEFDGFNCRCTMIPIDRYEWDYLKKGGVRVSKFSELVGFCGGKGGTPGPCPEGGSDGKHDVKLPAKPKKLNIDQATAALHGMGYTLGAGKTEPHEGLWVTTYEVTAPDGTKKRATARAIQEIVYANRRVAEFDEPVGFCGGPGSGKPGPCPTGRAAKTVTPVQLLGRTAATALKAGGEKAVATAKAAAVATGKRIHQFAIDLPMHVMEASLTSGEQFMAAQFYADEGFIGAMTAVRWGSYGAVWAISKVRSKLKKTSETFADEATLDRAVWHVKVLLAEVLPPQRMPTDAEIAESIRGHLAAPEPAADMTALDALLGSD